MKVSSCCMLLNEGERVPGRTWRWNRKAEEYQEEEHGATLLVMEKMKESS